MIEISRKRVILLLGDVFLLYLSLVGALFFRFGESLNFEIFWEHLLPFSILFLFWLIIFYIFGLYDLNIIKIKFAFFQRILGAILVCFILGITFFYLIPFFGITPKTNLLLSVLIFGILFGAWRKLFYFLFSSRFLNNVAILGTKSLAQEIAKEIIQRPYLGYKLKVFFETEPLFQQKSKIGEIKVLNAKEGLLSKIQKENIDTLIIAINLEAESPLTKDLYQCLPSKVSFMDLAKAYEVICEKIPISFVTKLWFLENLREKEKGWHDKTKRITDVILASLILLFSFPLWIIIALVIKLEDRGPIFYHQKRIGKDKKPFMLVKFRSMREDAEKAGPVWAKRKDPRITRVGNILRASHLDELPQMLNVIKGDISLVGPRPERPKFVQELEEKIPHYNIRHLIRPGFTGWAQLNFRYARTVMDSFEKFQYDLYYLKNRSLMLDFRILLKTSQLFFKKE